MKRAFEENEVFEVAKALNGDKALGSDDFSLDFFQTCKEVIKEDIMNVFLEFHVRDKFERSLHATFIALIPRRVEVVDIKDFRPIRSLTVISINFNLNLGNLATLYFPIQMYSTLASLIFLYTIFLFLFCDFFFLFQRSYFSNGQY
jgi:hypothetical protein